MKSPTKKQTNNQYYSAKHERVFYTIMLNEKNHILMESLLSTILNDNVKIISYPRTKLKVKSTKDKAKESDILIKLKGKYIHLEIETSTSTESKFKNIINFFTFYTELATRGKRYDTKTNCIHICLQFGKKSKKLIKRYHIREDETNELLTKNLEWITVYMDNLQNICYSKDIEKYKYLMMLDMDRKELKNFCKEDKVVEMFRDGIIKLNDNPVFTRLMSKEQEDKMLFNTRLYNGIEKRSKQNSIKIAKSLLSMGCATIEQISQATGLSIKEIEKLNKN